MAHLQTPIFLPYGSLKNWYDSTDTSTITLSTGDTVADWRDKSYDTNNLSEVDYTDLPVYGTTNINGLSTVDFDGGTAINLDDSTSTSIDISSDCYMVYAGFNNTYASTSTMFQLTNATLDNLIIRNTSANKSQLLIKDGAAFNLNIVLNSPGGVDNRAVIYTIDNVGNDVTLAFNYTDIDSGIKNGNPDPFTKLTLGAQSDDVNGLGGQVGELVIVQADDISLTNKQKLEGYIAWKWGMVDDLPGDHPYKSAAPTVTDVEFRDKLFETSTEEGSSRFRRLFVLGYSG